ncbi:hypothetical protein TUM20983_55230 [Mycobacterium antarcticum]|nr:hypothetical protein TUM20983_55230 [Mycolicibacterium sp. TUM20983]
MAWTGDGIAYDVDLEASFEEIAQVRRDTHVREHPAKRTLLIRRLRNCRVRSLRAEYFVRSDDHRARIVDEGLELRAPVGSRAVEPVEGQRALPVEGAGAQFVGLGCAVEQPAVAIPDVLEAARWDFVPRPR